MIEAAETMETTRVRKDALAAMEELKRKGPGYKRDMATWARSGRARWRSAASPRPPPGRWRSACRA